MSQIQIEVDEDVSKLLGNSPEEIERHVLEMIVLELYRRRDLSAGRAASLLGLDLFAFVRWAGSRGIPYFDLTSGEWQQELHVLDRT